MVTRQHGKMLREHKRVRIVCLPTAVKKVTVSQRNLGSTIQTAAGESVVVPLHVKKRGGVEGGANGTRVIG
jgi:hypothetical protein